MIKTVIRSFVRNGDLTRKLHCTRNIYRSMKKRGKIQTDKLLWRVIADGAPRIEQEFDLAVAWLEGASAYYTADYVNAAKKAAFIHIDYESTGYTREMDLDCFDKFDKIFTVSDETRDHFINVYPEHALKTGVFHNVINTDDIKNKARLGIGFTDGYEGKRLLTVGRLTYQKAYDIAIDAMKILKDSGQRVRWYVLGEGTERKTLEKKIARLGLEQDFILMGAVDNPYPYYAQTDIYVHATRFEGKSIAIQEAQILGCPVIATDCRGNREQIENGRDGILCGLTAAGVADSILKLLNSEEDRKAMSAEAVKKNHEYEHEMQNFLTLLG